MAGQLINRGERTWLVRVFLGRDVLTGKKKYHNKTVKGTKKDAQRYLNGVLRDIDLGKFAEPKKISLNKFLEKWLSDAVKPRVRERTYHSYEQLLKCYVYEGLGPRRLSSVTSLDIQELYSAMLDRNLSVVTVRKLNTVLGNALKQAVKWGMLGRNPMDGVELPKDRNSRREEKVKIMPLDRVSEFLQHSRCSKWGIVFAVALGTGMRPGEYFALKWEDLEVEQQLLRVRRTLYRHKTGGWSFQAPKTKGSVRSIALPGQLVQDLLEHRDRQAREFGEHQELMFTSRNGQPLFSSNFRRRELKPLLRELGMDERIHLYALRHTHITMLLAAGVHPKLVAERAGHASVKMTLDVYSHVVPAMQWDVGSKLNRLLYGDES